MFVFSRKSAFLIASYGSPKTQNFEDALAHTQSGQPLARFAAKQMSAVWQFASVAHCMSVVWLLQGPTNIDRRREVEGFLSVRSPADFGFCNQRLKPAKFLPGEDPLGCNVRRFRPAYFSGRPSDG